MILIQYAGLVLKYLAVDQLLYVELSDEMRGGLNDCGEWVRDFVLGWPSLPPLRDKQIVVIRCNAQRKI